MIKSVRVTAIPKSERDFEILVNLIDTLGLYKGFVGETSEFFAADFFPLILNLKLLYPKKDWKDVDLCLVVQDPDAAFEALQRLKLDVVKDWSGPEPDHAARDFIVKLPGGTRVKITGERVAHGTTDIDYTALEGNLKGRGKHFAIVVSRFNSFITERLLAGAIDGLARCGVGVYGEPFFKDIVLVRVPGSFEIPSAARTLAETKKYDAIICLGCLLRGDTAHYDVIVNEVTRGIGQSAQETGVPHAFGVLTCDTLEQAIDRAGLKMGNKGFDAALAAVEMANLKGAVSSQLSAVSKKGLRSQVSGARKSKAAPASRKRKTRS